MTKRQYIGEACIVAGIGLSVLIQFAQMQGVLQGASALFGIGSVTLLLPFLVGFGVMWIGMQQKKLTGWMALGLVFLMWPVTAAIYGLSHYALMAFRVGRSGVLFAPGVLMITAVAWVMALLPLLPVAFLARRLPKREVVRGGIVCLIGGILWLCIDAVLLALPGLN